MLFDEPLPNLDAALLVEIRHEIAPLHKATGATAVYVTRDQVETTKLAPRRSAAPNQALTSDLARAALDNCERSAIVVCHRCVTRAALDALIERPRPHYPRRPHQP